MSLIYIDGFENVSDHFRKFTDSGATADRTAVTSRPNSGNALRMTGSSTSGNNNFAKALGSKAHATIITGFSFKVASGVAGFPGSTADPFLRFAGDLNTTNHILIVFSGTSSGVMQVYRSPSTLLGSSTFTFVSGITYYIEVKAVLNDSTGAVTVKVNGDSIITLSSVDTKNAGTLTTIDTVAVGCRNSASATSDYDDFYIANGDGSGITDFMGDITVETLRPSGDGNYSQFTGSDGNSVNNSLLVDEATLDITDYVQGASGLKDSYAYGNLSATSATIKAVQAQAIAMKSASGAQSFKQNTRISSTDYAGTSTALSTSDVAYWQLWESSPATSTAWTISEVNGAEFGVEAV